MSCPTVNVFSLNVRGIRGKTKRKSVFGFLKKKKYDIVCLQETYITKSESEDWSKEWNGTLLFSEGTTHSAGQMILFNKNISGDYKVIHSSKRILIVQSEIENKQVAVVNVYAPNNERERNEFWLELYGLISAIQTDDIIMCGDFNCVLDNKLDIISGVNHSENAVLAFNDLINNCNLYDVWRYHNTDAKQYTWSRTNPFIARRLDYILTSSNIFDKVTSCSIVSIPTSDHRGCLIQISLSKIVRGKGYWKFNNSLLENSDYVNKINTLIDTFDSNESDSQTRWELLKIEIREYTIAYCKEKSMEKKNTVALLYNELNDMDALIASSPFCTEMQAKRENIKLQLEILETANARAAQTRARVRWIEQGEKNTKYFLGLEKARAANKIMDRVKDARGEMSFDQTEIHSAQRNYFANLYKKKIDCKNMDLNINMLMRDCIVPQLSEEQQNTCEGPLTATEMLYALKQMKNGSSPGSDGITIEFVKVFWTRISKFILDSFSLAFETGSMSPPQCKAVLVLIHKGKELPREELKNWRPISLTNSDYKLMAKCLAIRLNGVISNVISPDQVGYLKGRQVSTLLRLIDDVIEHSNEQNNQGILATIDFFHAFDCISKEFMLKAFQMFGFGPEFVKWVNVLMNNSKSSVNYCGWLSDFFPVESGIRQGCPFSSLGFVLAIELLAIKIRTSRRIKGISIKNKGNPLIDDILLKIALYADDITLFLEDEKDLQEALQIFDIFSRASGLSMNVNKCEAMWLGSKKYCQDTYHNFAWKRKLKILGIHFANDKTASQVEENWKERIGNVNRMISQWEKRNLSIMGKVCVIKTFLIPQFVYFMQAFIIPENVLIELNRTFFRFLWKRKHNNKKAFEKVKRVVMCNDTELGGIKMIDVRQMQTSFLLQWVTKLLSSVHTEKWSQIPNSVFSSFGTNYTIFHSNIQSKDFKGMSLIKSEFWSGVLKTWLDNNNFLLNTQINPLLWNNRFMMYNGKVLYFEEWAKKGLIKVHDVLNGHNFVSYENVCNLLGRTPNRILEYIVVRSAVLAFLRKHGNLYLEFSLTDTPLFHGIRLYHAKQFRCMLVHSRKTEPCSVGFWKNKFNYNINKSDWLMSFMSSQETRLRVLQWKLLHNIYPTNILLFKMKVTENNLCSYCTEKVDFIEHFFFDCPIVKKFWNFIESYILLNFSEKINLTIIEVMFGYKDIRSPKSKQINHVMLIAKMCISIFKKTGCSSMESIFEKQIKLRRYEFNDFVIN